MGSSDYSFTDVMIAWLGVTLQAETVNMEWGDTLDFLFVLTKCWGDTNDVFTILWENIWNRVRMETRKIDRLLRDSFSPGCGLGRT